MTASSTKAAACLLCQACQLLLRAIGCSKTVVVCRPGVVDSTFGCGTHVDGISTSRCCTSRRCTSRRCTVHTSEYRCCVPPGSSFGWVGCASRSFTVSVPGPLLPCRPEPGCGPWRGRHNGHRWGRCCLFQHLHPLPRKACLPSLEQLLQLGQHHCDVLCGRLGQQRQDGRQNGKDEVEGVLRPTRTEEKHSDCRVGEVNPERHTTRTPDTHTHTHTHTHTLTC